MHQVLLLLLMVCGGTFRPVHSKQVGEACTLKTTGANGSCKLSTDCPKAEEEAKRGISPTICGFHQYTTPIVCCESRFVRPNDNTFFEFPEDNPGPQETPAPSRPRLSKSEQKCAEYSKMVSGEIQVVPLVTNFQPLSVNIPKCNNTGVPLIVGGTASVPGQYPFMAVLGYNTDRGVEWKCGGTLISNRYVMTAAHCTSQRDSDGPNIARLGELDLSAPDSSQHTDYNVIDVIIHPQYAYPFKYNDIALLRLHKRVEFTAFIRPACLNLKRSLDGRKIIAAGWGKTDFLDDRISDKLMSVELQVYSNRLCSRTYANAKTELPNGISDTMMCAGELKGNKDTCLGDSGGPLVLTENYCKFFVAGITSFGKSCGQVNTPAVYTRVSDFVSWIENIVW